MNHADNSERFGPEIPIDFGVHLAVLFETDRLHMVDTLGNVLIEYRRKKNRELRRGHEPAAQV